MSQVIPVSGVTVTPLFFDAADQPIAPRPGTSFNWSASSEDFVIVPSADGSLANVYAKVANGIAGTLSLNLTGAESASGSVAIEQAPVEPVPVTPTGVASIGFTFTPLPATSA